MIPRRPLAGTRFGAGSYVSGVWVEGVPEAISLTASVLPTSGKELQFLPEGRRERASLTLYTSFELRASGPGVNADLVEIDGEQWEVVRVEAWRNGILPHTKAIVQRVQGVQP